jgi:hypothetical protein
VLNAVPFLGSARPWASLEFEALQYYIEIHRYTRIGVPGPGVLDPYIYNLFIHGMLYVVYIYIYIYILLYKREALGGARPWASAPFALPLRWHWLNAINTYRYAQYKNNNIQLAYNIDNKSYR